MYWRLKRLLPKLVVILLISQLLLLLAASNRYLTFWKHCHRGPTSARGRQSQLTDQSIQTTPSILEWLANDDTIGENALLLDDNIEVGQEYFSLQVTEDDIEDFTVVSIVNVDFCVSRKGWVSKLFHRPCITKETTTYNISITHGQRLNTISYINRGGTCAFVLVFYCLFDNFVSEASKRVAVFVHFVSTLLSIKRDLKR